MRTALFVAAMLQAVISPPLRSVDKGTISGVSAERHVTVSERVAWTALWREHSPSRPLPGVDFSREMVVGVFLGQRPSGGFAVEILGYREDGGQIVVRYRETMPSPGAITAQVILSPYHLVALPKQRGTVTFERVTT
jgi:hypothetical protein